MANTIIRASAGSGKTFQLSNRYLQIVFERKPVESILASTFTRKAAGEILDRILQRFAAAVLDETSRNELARHVTLPVPIRLVSYRDGKADQIDVPGALRTLLADVARNLYRLRIGTLDSFFNKIASAFALELGLPPGWTILDEADFSRYLGEAVRNVLAASDRNDARKLMNLLQKGEQDLNVTRELLRLAADLLPIVRESSPEAWDHQILERKELDETELQRVLDLLAAAPLPLNKDGSVPSRFVQAREKLGVLAYAGQWKSLLQQVMVKNVVSGEFKFDRKEIDGELLDAVRSLIEQAKAVQMNKLVGQTRATRQLLDLVVEAYDEVLYKNRRLRFEDVTERLGREDFAPALEAMAHRIDARTEHLLLDEFQDTSMPQWHVLLPFAEEAATAKDGSFFCVGDVKQAIYAWRGGVAGIFDTIEQAIPDVKPESLNVSYRSSPIIMKAVNELFGDIASNAALSDKFADAVLEWSRRFEWHDTSKKDLYGRCVLEVSPESSDDGAASDEDGPGEDDAFSRYTIERIAKLHENNPSMSIGVLVSRNKKIAELIAGLKRHKIEASEEGGNPLTDSAAVQHVLSAMVLADHPGDRIARFHLASGPLAECLRMTDYRDDRQAADCSLRLRRELLKDGYGPTVERLAGVLAPACNPREFQRLEKLIEMAFGFEDRATGVRTQRFIDMVMTTKVESPSASPIRVMTIHKSKGLEFDIVVLPDLDVDLVRRTPPLIVDRASPTSPIRFVLRYVGEELQPLLPPEYQEPFRKRIQAEVEESLSLLYVAMTRAIHELVMIVPPLSKSARDKQAKGKPTYPATFAGVLRAGLQGPETDIESSILYQITQGRPSPVAVPVPSEEIVEMERLHCRLAKKPAGLFRNLPRVSPSSLVRHEDVRGAGDIDHDDALLWGTAMHACFEYALKTVTWLDWGTPRESFLRDMVRHAVLGKKGKVDPDAVVPAFFDACEKPEIRKTLSLETYDNRRSGTPIDRKTSLRSPRWDVEHERRFSVRDLKNNRFLHGMIDRCVVLRDGDRVIGIDIIDYKTDRPEPGKPVEEFLRERRDIYAPQLEAYRDAAALLYAVDDKSIISTRLLFVALGRVF